MFPAQALAERLLAGGWRVKLSTDDRGARYAGGFPAEVAREIVPASWQWPERMATRVLAEATPWDAGQHLMASASRPSWEAIVAADRLLRDNREKIEGCRQTARKADQPVRCTIQVGAEK